MNNSRKAPFTVDQLTSQRYLHTKPSAQDFETVADFPNITHSVRRLATVPTHV